MFNVDMKNLCASGLPDIQPDVNWGKSNEVGRACKCLGIFWILEVPTLFYFSWNGVGIHVPPRTKLVVQVAYSGKWQRSGGNWQKKWLFLVQIATNSTESSVWVLRQDFAIGLEVLGLGIVCFYNTPTPFKASKHMAILSFPCCRTWHVPRPLNNKSPCAMGHWWGSRDEMPWTSLLMMFDGCVSWAVAKKPESNKVRYNDHFFNYPEFAPTSVTWRKCLHGGIGFFWVDMFYSLKLHAPRGIGWPQILQRICHYCCYYYCCFCCYCCCYYYYYYYFYYCCCCYCCLYYYYDHHHNSHGWNNEKRKTCTIDRGLPALAMSFLSRRQFVSVT